MFRRRSWLRLLGMCWFRRLDYVIVGLFGRRVGLGVLC